MERSLICISLLAAALLQQPTATAQLFGNPKVLVPIKHAPSLGINVKRVAFGPTYGPCVDQMLGLLTERLVNGGMDVLDRQNLNSILNEHKFSFSGYVDRQSAAQLGQILGATALIFVKFQRCSTEKQSLFQDVKDYEGRTVRHYLSRTRAFVRGTVQATDLATGRIFSAHTMDFSPSRENRSETGQPEFPAESELIDEALNTAANQAARLFIPWSESISVTFFDDKDCGLKQAFVFLSGGDLDGAVRQSDQNLRSCAADTRSKPKTLGHAHYNLALCQCLRGEYRVAFEGLTQAARLSPGAAVSETISMCQRSQRSEEEMRRLSERSDAIDRPVTTLPSPAAKPTTAAASPEERLRSLSELYNKGLITKEEYEKKKSQILSEI